MINQIYYPLAIIFLQNLQLQKTKEGAKGAKGEPGQAGFVGPPGGKQKLNAW